MLATVQPTIYVYNNLNLSLMSKSRNFSVYLLKEGFTHENALKEGHSLEEVADAENLPLGAKMYIADYPSRSPWWKNYWGINSNLQQSQKGAVVFLPVNDHWITLTFGMAFHQLKDESYEYDFGLRATLNAIDPDKIKSTDIFQPENARRQRIQTPVASNLNLFDFEQDESIIKKITGAVKEEHVELFRNATGGSSLRISTKANADEIIDLCSNLIDIYNRNDYIHSFPDIQNIQPIKDPEKLNVLNGKLLEAFRNAPIDLVLAIPEIVNYSKQFKVKFSGAGRSDKEYEDVYIGAYRVYLSDTEANIEDIDSFRRHKMQIIDENGSKIDEYSIYKSFLFDCEIDDEHFHLCDGEWYLIKSDYIRKLSNVLNPYFDDNHPLLSTCTYRAEKDYNKSISDNHENAICLDGKNISPAGQTEIEPCDIIAKEGEEAHLIHVKISTRSSSLSHLFNQGANSVELLRMEAESKEKLKNLVSNDPDLCELIDGEKFKVTYGIITGKARANPDDRSKNLPIFSRISLSRTLNALKLMNIPCSVYLIPDEADRRGEA